MFDFIEPSNADMHEASDSVQDYIANLENALLAAQPTRRLLPMSTAPRDGTEILAYHSEGKNLHQVMHKADKIWGMRWNREYSQHDNQFDGWIPMPTTIG